MWQGPDYLLPSRVDDGDPASAEELLVGEDGGRNISIILMQHHLDTVISSPRDWRLQYSGVQMKMNCEMGVTALMDIRKEWKDGVEVSVSSTNKQHTLSKYAQLGAQQHVRIHPGALPLAQGPQGSSGGDSRRCDMQERQLLPRTPDQLVSTLYRSGNLELLAAGA